MPETTALSADSKSNANPPDDIAGLQEHLDGAKRSPDPNESAARALSSDETRDIASAPSQSATTQSQAYSEPSETRAAAGEEEKATVPLAAARLSPDEVRDITQRLSALRPQIEAKDPALAKEIWAIDGAVSWEPKSVQDPHIQTRLAYAVEDAEKLTGKIDLPQPVREAATRLAGTSPGLENKQLEGLLRQTAFLNDPALVKDLRGKAAEISKANIGGEDPAQQAINASKIQNDIYALGYRVATAEPINLTAAEESANPAAKQPQNSSPLAAAAKQPAQNAAGANEAGKRQTVKSAATPSAKAQIEASDPSSPQARDRKVSSQTPGNPGNPSGNTRRGEPPSSAPAAKEGAANSRTQDQPRHQPNRNPEDEPDAAPQYAPPQQVTVVGTNYKVRPIFGGPFRNLLRNVGEAAKQQMPEAFSQPSQAASQPSARPAASQDNTAASKPATTIASLLPSYTQNRRQPEREGEAIQAAHDAAEKALSNLNHFRADQGAQLLNKIHDAAKTAKGGLPEVLSEMRAGGAYEDLRKEFNALYNQNTAFKETYDKASQTLTDYGQARAAANSAVHNQPQNELAGKLKALDEQIAKATEGVPGREEGQSITERLAEKAREIVDAILEKLRKTFDRTNEPSPSPSPSPSP